MHEDHRFVILETKFAYQDKLVSDLNDALIAQQKQLDTILARLHHLEGQFKNGAGDGEQPANDPPPHY